MNKIEENTVKAENQLKKNDYIQLEDNGGLRILFVGNSITRHGPKAEIGWYHDFGMAASDISKDYVHLVLNEFSAKQEISYCICQAAEWEWKYKIGTEVLNLYEAAKKFNADIIIMRIIENCNISDFNGELFEREYKKLIDYLNYSGKARIILTTSFWKHPGDNNIIKVGEDNGYETIYLGDLGELDEMKAIGKFQHRGVSIHPGDKGMRAIADRILNKIKEGKV